MSVVSHNFTSQFPTGCDFGKFTMSPPDPAPIAELLVNGPNRTFEGGKQLTLAFGGLYIASTSPSSKPLLVWETEKGYPRYYIPSESLHADIKSQLGGSADTNSHSASENAVKIDVIDQIKGKGNNAQAILERLTVGSRSTTWARFLEGPLRGLIRFERSEIGTSDACRPSCYTSDGMLTFKCV